MAAIKTSPTLLTADASNTPATLAAALTTNTAADPGRAFIVSADIAGIVLYFADAPTTAITMSLLGGIVYPFSVYKAVFGSGSAHNLY